MPNEYPTSAFFYNTDITVTEATSTATEPHSHDFLELAFVKEGAAIHVIGSTQTIIQNGDYFIVDYSKEHSYQSLQNGPLTIVNVLFRPSLIDKSLVYCRSFHTLLQHYLIKMDAEGLKIDPTNTVFSDDDGRVWSCIERLIDEHGKHLPGRIEMMRSTLIEILIRTMRKISDDGLDQDVVAFVQEAVTKNYLSPPTLNVLAKQTGYSAPYISLRFKEVTGIHFREYIAQVRMDEARRLLANTDKKIAEIAESVGYVDINSFYATFKKQEGVSPAVFRKQIRTEK
jgi:AraC-like DNA-binding protein